MLTSIYRKIIPQSFRIFIYDRFLGKLLWNYRHLKWIIKSKFIFCFQWIIPKTEENQAWAFMGQHGITSYPGKYSLDYKKTNITIEFDSNLKLFYITHNQKKLFFPASFTKDKIIIEYRKLLIEQDPRSAHRYVNTYSELKGKTLIDIGSADGNFALDTIDFTEHVYLFEGDDIWTAPLEATFAPWRNKVTFVKKYISDSSDNLNITIDEFLQDKLIDNLFLKIDIEGAEKAALLGASNTLKNGKKIQMSICTYHRKNDPEVLSNIMTSMGYQIEFTPGYIFWGKKLSKGLMRCKN